MDSGDCKPLAPIEKCESEASSKLYEDIASLYLESKFSDVAFIVEGQKIYAHKVILASRSEYFAKLLFGDLQESNMAEIPITDTFKKALEMLLKFIYTADLSVTSSNIECAIEVLRLANKYCFNNLEKVMEVKLKSILSLENVCQVLNGCKSFNSTEVVESCYLFMDNNSLDLVSNDSFNQLTQESLIGLLKRDTFFAPEIDIFKAVMKWQGSSNVEDYTAIQSIRFAYMSVDDIIKTVWPTGIINSGVLMGIMSEIIGAREKSGVPRARLTFDKNVAAVEENAEVISHQNANGILTSKPAADVSVKHVLGSLDGITIKLGAPTFINYIHLLLHHGDSSSFKYYIEVSTDALCWKKVIDHTGYLSRTYQHLYFDNQKVLYIRIVGTFVDTGGNNFRVNFLKAYYTRTLPDMLNGIICPNYNVATPSMGAAVIQGSNASYLINGDITNRHNHTYHQLNYYDDCITVQLAQPYVISRLKLLLYDVDQRHFKYYIQTSIDGTNWDIVADFRNESCQSWQVVCFEQRPVIFIKIKGTYCSAGNNQFQCVHFECSGRE